MVDEIFSEAIVNGGHHTLMRRKLRPFCLWHRLLLELSKSPIMYGTAAPTWADIDFVSRICSSRYGQMPKRSSVWICHIRAIGLSYHEEMEKFSAYLRDYCAYPEFWEWTEPSSGGRTRTLRPRKNGMPEYVSITSRNLALGSAETLAAAWEMPVGLASWYATAYSQLKGADLDFKTAEQRKIIREEEANPGTHFNKGTPPPLTSDTIIIPGGYNGGRRNQ